MKNTPKNSEIVELSLTEKQANAVVKVLDLFMRLGIGQYSEIDYWLRTEVAATSKDKPNNWNDVPEDFEELLMSLKQIAGMPRNGSRGIFNPLNSLECARAYEINKVLDKVLAYHRNPNPEFKGVNYDGLTLRAAGPGEPAPVASCTVTDGVCSILLQITFEQLNALKLAVDNVARLCLGDYLFLVEGIKNKVFAFGLDRKIDPSDQITAVEAIVIRLMHSIGMDINKYRSPSDKNNSAFYITLRELAIYLSSK